MGSEMHSGNLGFAMNGWGRGSILYGVVAANGVISL